MDEIKVAKEAMFELLTKLSQMDADLQKVASGRISRIPRVKKNTPPEKIREGIDRMTEKVPEEHRIGVLRFMNEVLTENLKQLEVEESRIKDRVQPEDEPREKPEFQSFCKRKGEW